MLWVCFSNIPSTPILHHQLQPEQPASSSYHCLGKILPEEGEDMVRTGSFTDITMIPEKK